MQKTVQFMFLWVFLVFPVYCEKISNITCELAAFIENRDGTEKTLIDSGRVISDTELKSCYESTDECAKMVEDQAIIGTSGGNFTLVVDEKNSYTVGDVLCDKADAVEENVRYKVVQIYWRLCKSSWKPTSFKMPELLCCQDGLYVPCQALKSEL